MENTASFKNRASSVIDRARILKVLTRAGDATSFPSDAIGLKNYEHQFQYRFKLIISNYYVSQLFWYNAMS